MTVEHVARGLMSLDDAAVAAALANGEVPDFGVDTAVPSDAERMLLQAAASAGAPPWEVSPEEEMAARYVAENDEQLPPQLQREFLWFASARYPSDRLVPFSARKQASILEECRHTVRATQFAKWGSNGRVGVHWKGVRSLKDPWDLVLYQMLLWELRPATIVELGSFEGGTAIWLADVARAYGITTSIVSIDIVRPDHDYPDVRFVRGDLSRPRAVLSHHRLGTLSHPWLVIEDAHVNLVPVLEQVHSFLRQGDYLVVEDTCEPDKYEVFGQFARAHDGDYWVDTSYTDNFGYNATFNWNSILVRR